MEQNKWKKRAQFALYIAGLIIFLELSSSLVLNSLISTERMERFDNIFLTDPEDYLRLPHPYLDWVTPNYIEEQERYLSHLGGNRTEKIYVVALGGSTTQNGYPAHTEFYLNRRLEEINSPLRAVVFNFGVLSWDTMMSLQNYVYVVRYLHPDFVVIHHNVNDLGMDTRQFRQNVVYYPLIGSWEKTLLRNSRFYRLLKFTYLLAYNPLCDGSTPVPGKEVDVPMQTRLSSYLNQEGGNPRESFRYDFMGDKPQYPKISLDFLLTENYESLINYPLVDNSTPIMTTQYINWTRHLQFHKMVMKDGEQLQGQSRDVNNLLRNISARHNVTLVDLDAEMEPYDYLLIEDGVHFTEEGRKIKGELIGKAIFGILTERYNLSGTPGEAR